VAVPGQRARELYRKSVARIVVDEELHAQLVMDGVAP